MAKIDDATDSMPTPNVIRVGERFTARRPITTAVTATVIRPDFRVSYWRPEKIHRTLGPSVKRLPFVTIKRGSRCDVAASYWNDVPTGDGREDFRRGKRYAALAIEAMTADGCSFWYLEKIIQAIVVDAVSRKVRGGKHSRTLAPAVDGFIHELSNQFCTSIAGIEPTS